MEILACKFFSDGLTSLRYLNSMRIRVGYKKYKKVKLTIFELTKDNKKYKWDYKTSIRNISNLIEFPHTFLLPYNRRLLNHELVRSYCIFKQDDLSRLTLNEFLQKDGSLEYKLGQYFKGEFDGNC